MGSPQAASPVKLVAGLLASSDAQLAEARDVLPRQWGPIDALSTAADWTASDYYRDEMGRTIRRQFVSFERLIAADALATLKLHANEMEAAWRIAGQRRVNIDPGYVAATKLVLASTKDAAHRIYLGCGIYAEVTLAFSAGSFRPRAETYRDYAAPEAIAFFNGVRAGYLAQLRGAR